MTKYSRLQCSENDSNKQIDTIGVQWPTCAVTPESACVWIEFFHAVLSTHLPVIDTIYNMFAQCVGHACPDAIH